MRYIAAILLTILASLPVAAAGASATAALPAAPATTAPPAPVERIDDVAATERSVVRVVTIAVVSGQVVGFGHGSGFAIAPNRIVTNAHVVENAEEYPQNVIIGIIPSEGTRGYRGRLLALDRQRDLALIELTDGGRLPPATLYSGAVQQRSLVYALGYPGNVDLATARNMEDFIRPRSPVASDGIVSSSDAVNGVDALVHDADIARGNSGGPLVDACGRVLGVNSFISRADDGDSPFSFAVSVREISAFLREAGQSFTAIAQGCVTAEQAAARDAASASDAARQRSAAEAAVAAQRQASAERLQQLRHTAERSRDNVMALAIALFGAAVLAGGMAILYQSQQRARHQRIAMIAAGALTLVSLIAFLLRPDPWAVRLEPSAADAAAAAAAPVPPRFGSLSCRVRADAGRITVSTNEDLAMTITPSGCVNGRTQYVAAGGNLWSRTLVPEMDATVTQIQYDAGNGRYVARRFLLPLTTMEAVRRQRQAVATPACTNDPTVMEALSRRETAIAQLLPRQPNEEIVRDCVAVATPATPVPRE